MKTHVKNSALMLLACVTLVLAPSSKAQAIISQPQSRIVANGASVSFTVSVAGTAPLFYQWLFNGTNLTDGGNIAGSTTSNLVISIVNINEGGSYTVIVTNTSGSVTSSVAKLTVVSQLASPNATAVDIGTLNGSSMWPRFMNNSGQVAGYAFNADGSGHAFLYSGGTLIDLGTLGGTSSFPNGLNNSGQVVGYAFTTSGDQHAFLYSDGIMTDLGTLGGTNSEANGINNNGQVVGWTDSDNLLGEPAFLFSGGAVKALSILSGPKLLNANGINDGAQIAGYYQADTNGLTHACIYSSGTVTDLGTPSGLSSQTFAINNSGQITGTTQTTNGTSHAFLYSNGTMTDLGALSGTWSYPKAINNNGQVIGYAYNSTNYGRAFLSSGGMTTDLGTLGGLEASPFAINNSGQIVGGANISNGDTHGFLYKDGTMTDLNNMVNMSGGVYFTQGALINDSGDIVAVGNNGHAYFLTPGGGSAGSAVTLQATAVSNGIITFSWNALTAYPPLGYQIQYTTDLTSGNWVNVGGAITNGITSFSNSVSSSPQGFYRIELVQ